MTIASEVTRLQNDKAAICTAIENKGVTVGNVTLDSYAACIDAIQGGKKSVDFLLIAGGGGGGGASTSCGGGGGGGAGGVREGTYAFGGDSISVTVGGGGSGGAICTVGSNGGDSCLQGDGDKAISVCGGGGGGRGRLSQNDGYGSCGGSGGGAGWGANKPGYPIGGMGELGTYGGVAIGTCTVCQGAGGGGGASGGGQSSALRASCCYNCMFGAGAGGMGLEGTWGCKSICYAGGGGGGYKAATGCGYGRGHSGGGNGGYNTSGTCWNGKNATTCGSGGGGGGVYSSCYGTGGNGAGGLVIIGYNCVCKDCNGFTCATGGDSCYVCGDCKFHCFTSNGTFTIVS